VFGNWSHWQELFSGANNLDSERMGILAHDNVFTSVDRKHRYGIQDDGNRAKWEVMEAPSKAWLVEGKVKIVKVSG
jgi:hypothetical protein